MPNVKDLACEYRTTLEPCLDEPPSPLSASDNDCVSGLGRVMMSGSTLLNNLGLGVDPARPEGSERLYRSMENLQWVTEPSLYSFGGQYRSVDSELIFRCTTSTSSRNHWYGVPLRMPVRKDMQLLPQWLLPPADERVDIRRGLKEKLRSQTTRLIEPSRPLRPPGVTSALPGVLWETCDRQLAPPCPSHSHAIPSVCRITSPQEIKQEVIRRLQLRRQVSTPDLSLPRPEEQAKPLAQATSTQSILDSTLERKRPPAGRLHIPTFEEFKRMRQKEVAAKEGRGPGTEGRNHLIETRDLLCRSTEHVNDQCFHGNPTEAPSSSDTPVCTSPTPHPLQQGPVQATPTQTCLRPEASSSTCCPGLLLDTTELSAYGAKITRIRDGLLGSALGLIKKSCSAEIAAEDHIRMSHDRYEDSGGDDIRGTRPPVVAMATEAHSQEAEEGECADCHSPTLGCRRSSSDAAYQPAESARAQRECRLRPHYSDPMPANATKRKQLEMKLAAAARLHVPESHIGRETTAVGVARVEHQRWSNLSNTSSLSVDSGVVGLSDEQDKEAEPRRCTRGAEVERTDSGIGSGLARSWRRPCASIQAWDTQRPCIDCGHRDPARRDAVCEKCCKLRTERKEALLEFLNTECSYGEDLRIIREEFYCPMQAAGLLTAEQLNVVFGNVQELIDVNDSFTQHLQESITQAFNKGDEDLLTVCIGEIFLEFVNMLPAFQTYCLQQSASVNMLNSLEKEKELLRIFLDVSQNDNTALRRMNLRSFLMAPLQRVTKYPLLLSRISKSTSGQHPDHGRLREAKSRVESHLEHINRKTKQQECGGGGAGAPWSLRSFRRESRRSREAADVEMREVSLRTVGWARESTQFVMEGPLQLSQPTDGSWVRKGSRSLKFQNVQSVLMVHGREPVQDGVLVLIKDKSGGKFAVLREPIRLGNCVVSADPDCEDAFELLDIPREAFVFRAADRSRTQQWFHQIRRYSHDLGPWRKRRNALPNIMISTGPNKS